MFSFPATSSSSAQRSQLQTDAPISTNALSEQYFHAAFSPVNGDLLLGLSSVTRMQEPCCAWSPVRLMESLLATFNLMAERPDISAFVGSTGTEIKITIALTEIIH